MKHIFVLLVGAFLITLASCGNNNGSDTQKDSADMLPQDHPIPADSIKQGDSLHRDSIMMDTIARKRIPMN